MDEDTLAGKKLIEKWIGEKTTQGNLLRSLWKKAKEDIHSYQIGPTDKGSKHCSNVADNIGRLLAGRITKDNEINKKAVFILSAAAALHDIAESKFCEIKNVNINHGRRGAEIIRKDEVMGYFFGSEIDLAEAVSYLVSSHDDGLIDKGIPEQPKPFGSPPRIHLRSLAALFRLADMLDTTDDRVSYIQRLMVTKLPDVYVAREAIRGWDFNDEDQREILLHTGIIKPRAEKIARQYVDELNEMITESQTKYLTNFENIYFRRKKVMQKLVFPYIFKLAE